MKYTEPNKIRKLHPRIPLAARPDTAMEAEGYVYRLLLYTELLLFNYPKSVSNTISGSTSGDTLGRSKTS